MKPGPTQSGAMVRAVGFLSMRAHFVSATNRHAIVNALAKYVCDPDPLPLVIAEDSAVRQRVKRTLESRPSPYCGRNHPLVLPTSGTTRGRPHLVALSRRALLASAEATHDALGGAGRWITALPLAHIAGIQTVVRTVAAGFEPLLSPPGPFNPPALAQSIREATGSAGPGAPTYLSLVAAQLSDALDEEVRELADLDAVLVGGGFVDPALLDRARQQGVRVVTTYGMTETAGGCVYDGVPLGGVNLLERDGRILVGGATLMDGYLDEPSPWEHVQTEKWLVTGDLGHLSAQGKLRITGREDDLIKSGGIKVNLRDVEQVLQAHQSRKRGWGDVCVIPIPDAKWGAGVGVLAEFPGTQALDQSDVEAVALEMRRCTIEALGVGAGPAAVHLVSELDRTALGKADRAAAAARLEQAIGQGRAWQR